VCSWIVLLSSRQFFFKIGRDDTLGHRALDWRHGFDHGSGTARDSEGSVARKKNPLAIASGSVPTKTLLIRPAKRSMRFGLFGSFSWRVSLYHESILFALISERKNCSHCQRHDMRSEK
jgi:hypothetical protein